MGGTTAKASLVENGQVNRTTEYEVGAGISLSSRLVKGGGHALKLPVVDVAEVGAGGGSIVWIDRAGNLKVGPKSAGATPGPACYEAGGTAPTITDVNVILGYCNPRYLTGGAVSLRADLAEAALTDAVARPLGLALIDAAYGAFAVANATMIRAIKAVTTYRGRDPRDFALLAFGGSGPIHAAAIARALQIRRVVVPLAPGLFSAIGLLEAEPELHFARTFFRPLATLDLADFNAAYGQLEVIAREALRAEGYPVAAATNERLADLRYAGQAYELTVPVPTKSSTREDLLAIGEAFEREHERTYGHRSSGEPVEIVNLRLVARVARERSPAVRLRSVPSSTTSDRRVHFGPEVGTRSTLIIGRGVLDCSPRPGPFIVEEYDATVVVPPDCTAWLDELANILIEVG